MYLAHELALLGSEYSNVLKNNIVTFVDFVEPLRSLGHSALNDQVDKQREQLVEILRQSGNTTEFFYCSLELLTFNKNNLYLKIDINYYIYIFH